MDREANKSELETTGTIALAFLLTSAVAIAIIAALALMLTSDVALSWWVGIPFGILFGAAAASLSIVRKLFAAGLQVFARL